MDITVRNLQSSIPIPQSKIKSTVLEVCSVLKLSKVLAEVSIVLVGTRRMRTINKSYLGHDYVTDVITFDLGGAGEIVICPQVALANSKSHGQVLNKEMLLYVIHGLLHLAGFNDHKPEDIKKIRSKEKQLMDRFV